MNVPDLVKEWWGAAVAVLAGTGALWGARKGFTEMVDDRIDAKVQPGTIHSGLKTLERKLDELNTNVRGDVKQLDEKIDAVAIDVAGLQGERRAQGRPAGSSDSRFFVK